MCWTDGTTWCGARTMDPIPVLHGSWIKGLCRRFHMHTDTFIGNDGKLNEKLMEIDYHEQAHA